MKVLDLLSVDPGTRCTGWALWGKHLEQCGLVRTKEEELGARGYALAGLLPSGDFHVVVELPRVFPYQRKMRPNDLIDLAFIGGMCAFRGASASMVHPVIWKGQEKKEVNHKRVLNTLTAGELAVVKKGIVGVPKTLQHNVLDAVGIGLWYRTRKRL